MFRLKDVEVHYVGTDILYDNTVLALCKFLEERDLEAAHLEYLSKSNNFDVFMCNCFIATLKVYMCNIITNKKARDNFCEVLDNNKWAKKSAFSNYVNLIGDDFVAQGKPLNEKRVTGNNGFGIKAEIYDINGCKVPVLNLFTFEYDNNGKPIAKQDIFKGSICNAITSSLSPNVNVCIDYS